MSFDPLAQLVELDVDGHNVGDLLDLAHSGVAEAISLLSRHGIAWGGESLTLDTTSPALGKLLLSPLLREPSASFDLDSGLLSISLAHGGPVGCDLDGGEVFETVGVDVSADRLAITVNGA